MGLLDFREPATRLFNQGMILGEDHEKMSKSRGNVVNPDDLVQRYGSDTVRMYLMFLGPWDAGAPWNPHGIEGASRFLRSVWALGTQEIPVGPSGDADAEQKVRRALHQTIKKVTDDLQHFCFNTAIAALMSFRNQLRSGGERIGSELREEAIRTLLLLLAPLAPHLTEELWQRCCPDSGSVHIQPWPEHDEALAADALVTLVVQVNGKLRDRLEVPTGMGREEVERLALESEKIQPHLSERSVRKVIVVPDRLVNIVV
jgi:leucyl-tRNA synthetase